LKLLVLKLLELFVEFKLSENATNYQLHSAMAFETKSWLGNLYPLRKGHYIPFSFAEYE
jgi:hypothetical protein